MYKNLWDYKKEDIEEIMYKPIKLFIGKSNSNEIEEQIDCKITNCTLASNFPYQPVSFRVENDEGVRTLSITRIKKFEINF
jgi:hypothetical protein